MSLPMKPGRFFISSFTATGKDEDSRGVTMSLSDDKNNIIVEIEMTHEAFGTTVVRHSDEPCIYHRFPMKGGRT